MCEFFFVLFCVCAHLLTLCDRCEEDQGGGGGGAQLAQQRLRDNIQIKVMKVMMWGSAQLEHNVSVVPSLHCQHGSPTVVL